MDYLANGRQSQNGVGIHRRCVTWRCFGGALARHSAPGIVARPRPREPGIRPYSMDLRVRVLTALDAGDPTGEVADTFAVSPAWVRRPARRRETGEVAPWTPQDTRVPQLAAHLLRIREFLAATPDMTLSELRVELRVAVALSALWAAVRDSGIRSKTSRPRRTGRPTRGGPTGPTTRPGPAPRSGRRLLSRTRSPYGGGTQPGGDLLVRVPLQQTAQDGPQPRR